MVFRKNQHLSVIMNMLGGYVQKSSWSSCVRVLLVESRFVAFTPPQGKPNFVSEMEPALFSLSSLFNHARENDEEEVGENEDSSDAQKLLYVERRHAFPGEMELVIREFSFHQLNANLLWPGTFAFSQWLVQNRTLLEGQRILELGSGTGALSIFLRRSFGVDITTSDFDDIEVEDNIAHNCRANELAALPHIRHTWGDIFPNREPDWELIIASDILLYVKQYSNLIQTLSFLLNSYKAKQRAAGVERCITISGKEVPIRYPLFLMSWRRRIGREEEALFFDGCKDAGLVVEHIGSRVYFITTHC